VSAVQALKEFIAAHPLLSNTQTASGTITDRKGSRLAAASSRADLNNVISDTWKRAIVDLPCWSEGLLAGPAAATDCITSYRRSMSTMLLAAAAAHVVRGDPTEHRPSRTSIASSVAVVMHRKLSTAVPALMIVTLK